MTPAGIASMLEVTFVKACMQLSTGFVDVLKLFIAAAVSGYERGFTIPALTLELEQVAAQTAGRPLVAEEADLRIVWLALVYMTLEQVNHKTAAVASELGSTVPADIRQKFNTFVYDIINAKAGGWTLQTLKLEDAWLRSGNEVDIGKMTDLEKAVLSQSMRIIFLTLTVLEETALASGESVPKPNIPGI